MCNISVSKIKNFWIFETDSHQSGYVTFLSSNGINGSCFILKYKNFKIYSASITILKSKYAKKQSSYFLHKMKYIHLHTHTRHLYTRNGH